MRTIRKLTALFIAVLILVSMFTVSAGAVKVVKGGEEYTLRSHTPTTGDVNVLMIRLGFADYAADDEDYPADSEDTLLSYFDGSENSVNGFYETSSYGKLHLHCDKVYNYNAVYDRGDYGGGFAQYSVDDLLVEALNALKGEIDYNDFDSDGDGHLDIVCFDFAGPMGEWGETWWPHVANNSKVEIEGKKLSKYSILRGEVFTFKHEFGHIFGAADYYSHINDHDNMIMTYDMMCTNIGDHNGFTKWSYGSAARIRSSGWTFSINTIVMIG